MEKAQGELMRGKSRSCTMQPRATLADLGIEKTQSHRWQLMATVPEEEIESEMSDNDMTPTPETEGAPDLAGESAEAPASTPADDGKRSRGGQQGNQNRQRHGVMSYLRHSSLPKGCQYIQRQSSALARALEKAVRKRYGKITLPQRERINRAVRAETTCKLLDKWLCQKDLPLEERLKLLQMASAAVEQRGKAFASLQLDPESFSNKKASIRDLLLDDDTDDEQE